jgi:hypothetical protein
MDRPMYLDTCLLDPRTGITNVRGLLKVTPLSINENFTGNAVRKAIRAIPKHEFTPIIFLGGMSYISSQVLKLTSYTDQATPTFGTVV